MNSTPGSGQDTSSRIEILVEQKDKGPSATSAAELESKLEEEKAERRKERFIWIMIVTLLSDCILFKFLDSTFPSVFVILISVSLLIYFAKWLEVPWIAIHLERIFSSMLAPTSEHHRLEPPEEI